MPAIVSNFKYCCTEYNAIEQKQETRLAAVSPARGLKMWGMRVLFGDV